jgi:hypothetical protein
MLDRYTFHNIDILIGDSEYQSLSLNPRWGVTATIVIDQTNSIPVSVHLKGTSSFQSINRKPSFSCKPKSKESSSLDSIFSEKFYLHNNVQDTSLLADYLAKSIYRSHGLGVGDIAFASVRVNGRPRGLYTIVEAVSRAFLMKHFVTDDGLLLEGSISDRQDGPLDSTTIDERTLSSLMVADYICGNKDGFTFGGNNYWYYRKHISSKWIVFPHTSDAAFSSSDCFELPVRHPIAAEILADPDTRHLIVRQIKSTVEEEQTAALSRLAFVSTNLLADIVLSEPDRALSTCASMRRLLSRMTNHFDRLIRATESDIFRASANSDPRAF